MGLRANLILALAAILAVVQMLASATGGPRIQDASAAVVPPNSQLSRSVAAQDDNDNDDEDNDDDDNDEDDDNDDEDNDDSDNDDDDDNDEDSDNDEDNDDDDSDNDDDDDEDNDDGEDLENVEAEEDYWGEEEADDGGEEAAVSDDDGFSFTGGTAATPTPAPAWVQQPAWAQQPAGLPMASPSPSPMPLMEVQAVTTGTDQWIALPEDRIGLQVSASTPAGITLRVRLVDPLAYPAANGIRAGDLIFLVEAVDAEGYTLTTLPAEARLSVRYTDMDILGLDETTLTLSRLDEVASIWNPVLNIVIDPLSNYLEVFIIDTGIYVVAAQ